MAEHPPHHSRHTGNTLQKDTSDQPLAFIHGVPLMLFGHLRIHGGRDDLLAVRIAGGGVHTPAEEADHGQGHSVREVLGFPVSHLNGSHILFGITRKMSKSLFNHTQQSRRVCRTQRYTYTGCFHAGSVVLICGASFGGSKYSFRLHREDVENNFGPPGHCDRTRRPEG